MVEFKTHWFFCVITHVNIVESFKGWQNQLGVGFEVHNYGYKVGILVGV